MIALFDTFVRYVLPGMLVGGIAGVLFMRRFGRWMERVRGTDDREYHCLGAFENSALHALEEPATGGAVGYPCVRRGSHTLRILPGPYGPVVVRRRDRRLVAQLTTVSDAHAERILALLERHLAEELENDPHAPASRGREVVLERRVGRRRLALLRSGSFLKVVDLEGGKLRGAAVVQCVEHGRELIVQLAAPPVVGPSLPPVGADSAVPVRRAGAEPADPVARASEPASMAPALEPHPFGVEPEPDWDRWFR
jgi:hypothetical protein